MLNRSAEQATKQTELNDKIKRAKESELVTLFNEIYLAHDKEQITKTQLSALLTEVTYRCDQLHCTQKNRALINHIIDGFDRLKTDLEKLGACSVKKSLTLIVSKLTENITTLKNKLGSS